LFGVSITDTLELMVWVIHLCWCRRKRKKKKKKERRLE